MPLKLEFTNDKIYLTDKSPLHKREGATCCAPTSHKQEGRGDEINKGFYKTDMTYHAPNYLGKFITSW